MSERTVYALYKVVEYEGEWVLGVFDTREDAERARNVMFFAPIECHEPGCYGDGWRERRDPDEWHRGDGNTPCACWDKHEARYCDGTRIDEHVIGVFSGGSVDEPMSISEVKA